MPKLLQKNQLGTLFVITEPTVVKYGGNSGEFDKISLRARSIQAIGIAKNYKTCSYGHKVCKNIANLKYGQYCKIHQQDYDEKLEIARENQALE